MPKNRFFVALALGIAIIALAMVGGLSTTSQPSKQSGPSAKPHSHAARPHIDNFEQREKALATSGSESSSSVPGPFTIPNLSARSIKCVPEGTPYAFSLYYARSRTQSDKFAQYAPAIRESFYAASVWIDSAAWKRNKSGIRLKVECSNAVPIVRKLVFDEPAKNINWDVISAYFSYTGATSKNRRAVVIAPESGSGYYGLGSYWNRSSPLSGFGLAVVFQSTAWTGVTHEIAHSLGAVSSHSPNKTEGSHCVDGMSTMCRSDDGTAGGERFRIVCPATLYGNPATGGRDGVFDCNYDDYFNPSPPAGSLLARNPKLNLASTQNRFFMRATNPDNHPPVAGPIAVGTTNAAQRTAVVSVFADDTRKVKRVQFLVDGATVGTPGVLAPVPTAQGGLPRYRATLNLRASGTYQVVARIHDVAGNVTQTSPVSITV